MTSEYYYASEEFRQNANVNAEVYKQLSEKFEQDEIQFWSELARKNLLLTKDFQTCFDYSQKPFFKWFKEAELNISANCVDINLPKRANKTAIIFEDEKGFSQKITYQELYVRVNQVAAFLVELGIKKSDAVCIYMPLCPEAIYSMLACMRIGAIHSVVFAGFSAVALGDRIRDQGAKYIITADAFQRKGEKFSLITAVREAIKEIDFIQKIVLLNKTKEFKDFSEKIIDFEQAYDNPEAEFLPVAVNAEDTSFVLYTSGSTGKPKGIVHSTAGYMLWTKLSTNWVFDLKEDDIYWCTADIGWITGHSYVVYGPLANGATIFIYEGTPNYPDYSRFWSLIEKYKINIFYTAPTAIRTFMHAGDEFVTKHDLSSLRLLGSVGEPINPSVWLWFYENIGKKNCPIVDTWWQTETGGIMITTLPGIDPMKPGSAGKALPGIRAGVNSEDLLYLDKPVPSMVRNIHNNSERYIKAYWSIIPDKYSAGDAAHLEANSYFTIVGRVDDVLNVSGHRIGTAEVESALVAHDSVSEAAVIGVNHEIKGEAIVAFVVLDSKAEKGDELERVLKDQVVKEIGAIARPEKITVVSALPKTRSGKIMRRLLKDIANGKSDLGDTSTLENKAVLDELIVITRSP